MVNILRKCVSTRMINKVLAWDFCPEPHDQKNFLTVRPIVLSLGALSLDDVEYAALTAKDSGIDILQNGGYPFFDGVAGHLICGNPKVAAAILKTGLTSLVKSKKPLTYPVYFN